MTTCLRRSVVLALAVLAAWLPSAPAEAAAKKPVRKPVEVAVRKGTKPRPVVRAVVKKAPAPPARHAKAVHPRPAVAARKAPVRALPMAIYPVGTAAKVASDASLEARPEPAAAPAAAPAETAVPVEARPAPAVPGLEGVAGIQPLLNGAKWNRQKQAYVTTLANGREAELTLDHDLQEHVKALLSGYRVPYASVVALDPRTGRILAAADTSDRPDGAGSTTKALFPAASVFKIVTGAALLEAGIAPDTEVCFHGGLRALGPRELRDDPRRDNRCETLSTAMGKSLNVVFGKLASRNLSADVLRATAGRFFFNQPLPVFPSAPGLDEAFVSHANIPDDALGFGRAAAGFGKVYLSPMHGAMLAGVVANRGVAVEPQLVSAVTVEGQRTVVPPGRETRIVDEATSAQLTRMMERTVSEGTARKAFNVRWGGRHALGSFPIAGKTGSLADHPPLPFKDYSWFVGFAPADDPKVAVAAVVVNGPKWVVKGPYLARETMRSFFSGPGGAVRHATR